LRGGLDALSDRVKTMTFTVQTTNATGKLAIAALEINSLAPVS